MKSKVIQFRCDYITYAMLKDLTKIYSESVTISYVIRRLIFEKWYSIFGKEVEKRAKHK